MNFITKPIRVSAWLVEESSERPEWVQQLFDDGSIGWCDGLLADGLGLCLPGTYLVRSEESDLRNYTRKEFHYLFEPHKEVS